MLWLLSSSSVTVLRNGQRQRPVGTQACQTTSTPGQAAPQPNAYAFPELALPQLVLAATAATTFHVQIVNRIASGYPTWYLVLAEWIVDRNIPNGSQRQKFLRPFLFRCMCMYAIVQGVLFANFLPPA